MLLKFNDIQTSDSIFFFFSAWGPYVIEETQFSEDFQGGEKCFFLMSHNFSQQYYVKYPTLPNVCVPLMVNLASWHEGERPGLNFLKSQCKSELLFVNSCEQG